MPRITLETLKQIGRVSRVYQETFIIPESIIHNEDQKIMHWDGYHERYECSCGETLSGKDFVRGELFNNLLNSEDESEM